MKRIITLSFIFVMFAFNAFATPIELKLSKDIITLGDSVVLKIKYSGDSKDDLDLDVLKEKFEVFSVTKSNNTMIINGEITSEKLWKILISPKSEGDISLPQIKIGNDVSNKISIKVVKFNSKSNKEDAPKFFVEDNLKNYSPYVQEKIDYTISIFDGVGIKGTEPNFAKSEDWIIRKLDNTKVSMVEKFGKDYKKYEITYALFPQKSGKLKLPEINFTGYYYEMDKNPDREVDSMFGDWGGFRLSGDYRVKKPFVLRVNEQEISVKKINRKNKSDWWIPATKIRLSSEWTDKTDDLKQGDAFTRRIILEAENLVDQQLPNLEFEKVDDVKQYQDKPIDESFVQENRIIGVRQFTNTYIANEAGEIEIPEIKLYWWNVKKDKLEKAVLASETININVNPEFAVEEDDGISKPVKSFVKEKIIVKEKVNYLYLALVLLFGYLLGFVSKKKKSKKITKEDDFVKSVISSAKTQDYKSLRDNLIKWGENNFGNVKNLDDLSIKLNNENLKKLFNDILSNAYGSNKDFDKNNFIAEFRKELKKLNNNKEDKVIKDLYK